MFFTPYSPLSTPHSSRTRAFAALRTRREQTRAVARGRLARVDIDAVRDRLDRERRTLARDGEIVDVLPHVTRLRGADGSYHTVTFSSCAEDLADAVIALEEAHHRALGAPFE